MLALNSKNLFPLNLIGTYLFYLCKYLLLSTYLPTSHLSLSTYLPTSHLSLSIYLPTSLLSLTTYLPTSHLSLTTYLPTSLLSLTTYLPTYLPSISNYLPTYLPSIFLQSIFISIFLSCLPSFFLFLKNQQNEFQPQKKNSFSLGLGSFYAFEKSHPL